MGPSSITMMSNALKPVQRFSTATMTWPLFVFT